MKHNSSYDTKEISFCTSIKNRATQLNETLAHNLDSLRPTDRIYIADFGSTDSLSDLVWGRFHREISSGRLIFFEVSGDIAWNSARAKSLAHRLANGSYLFNLDADNFITPQDINLIVAAAKDDYPVHQWSKVIGDGSYGRIELPRDFYCTLGGYDETLLPMGYQDCDLLERIFAFGQDVVELGAPLKSAIPNSLSSKMANVGRTKAHPARAYYEMNQLNQLISCVNLLNQGPVRHGSRFSYKGKLNGLPILIDGYDNISPDADSIVP